MTNELIKISTDAAGRTAVSGRELHEFLEIKDHRYTDWFSRMCEYGFVENQDFEVFRENPKNPQGGRPSIDHAMSIDMAKEISMIQRTDKGKEARRYFIECERQLREEKSRVIPPEQVLRIDGIPVDVPTGVPFSVTRSKTGVLTVRVKPASTPTKAPPSAPVPPAPQKPVAPPPILPSSGRSVDSYRQDSLPTRDVTLMGVHLKAANKLLTFMKQCRGIGFQSANFLTRSQSYQWNFGLTTCT